MRAIQVTTDTKLSEVDQNQFFNTVQSLNWMARVREGFA